MVQLDIEKGEHMKLGMKIVLSVSVSIILILLSVQIISTKPYMMIHEGLYSSHDDITWDYEYAVEQTMDYLNGFEDDLVFPSYEGGDDVLMTERGILHMIDVKNLYSAGRVIMSLMIVLASVSGIYLWDKSEFYSTLKRIWIFPLVFVGSITVVMLINFNWAFTQFHHLLFTNDLWLLSWSDPLIVMLPTGFFYSTAITIVVLIVLFHLSVIYLAYKKTPNK